MSQTCLLFAALFLCGCGRAPEISTDSVPKEPMNNAEQLYRKGTEFLESDPEKAIELLTQSLELGPDSPPALYNRAVAYARVGRDAEAVADIAQLEKVAPEIGSDLRLKMMLSAVPYSDLGNREFEDGNYEMALVKYNSALAYDPEYGDAWVGKGLVLNKLGKPEEALVCYNKVVEVEPDNFYAYINRAELHHEHKRLQDALADFSKAIELHPDEAAAYVGRSAVYFELKLFEQAEQDKHTAEELTTRSDANTEKPT